MKPLIHPSIIFRTPKFSYQTTLADCWDDLKRAIAISSTAFYETIKDIPVQDLQNLSPKVSFTIWKYFNRAKYRSTPYGTFASFSLLPNAIATGESSINIDANAQVHHFIDWPYRNEIQIDFNETIANNPVLFSNTSYYSTHDSLRYIACTDGVFELAEIEQNDFVKSILDVCAKPLALDQLLKKMNITDDGYQDFIALLADLHGLQLLFSDRDPNIIGEDYFDRIAIRNEQDIPQYIIAERQAFGGILDEKLLKPLPGLISLLSEVVPSGEREALKLFTQRFTKKFDQQEIPLLMALDPEMGVGYDELEHAGDDDFVGQFNRNKNTAKNENPFKSVLKSQISAQVFKKETVFLNKLNLPAQQNSTALPNSFSVLLSVVDDLLCIDQIGGTTANALTGRFSLASKAVENHCKEIAAIEQKANPNVLFFDVAYMVEAHVDNINRRKLIYEYQLSILNFDTSANPLSLRDIMVSVKKNEVILYSKSLNKRLIPRMASAYNYSRSDLSVFRLLCDLQHQGVQTSLSLSLDKVFPDLDFYPRFQYHNIILNTAKWRIRREDLFPEKTALSIQHCRAYLNALGLSRFFKTGQSDQTLCFDLNSNDDLAAFLQYMQNQSTIYLEEVIVPERSVVTDQSGKPYLAQYILNLYHEETIYAGLVKNNSTDHAVRRTFLPGREWLYYEIFCHQQRADELLTGLIPAFLDAHADSIKHWFFIRYNENGNHLRLRMRLKNEANGQMLTNSLMDHMQHYVNSGMVADVQIKTYKREIERYGADLIAEIEQHFAVDSEFVIQLLGNHIDAFTKYKWCSALVETLVYAEIFDTVTLIELIRRVSDSFNREHGLEAADFKKLNQQYQQYRNLPNVFTDEYPDFIRFSQSFIHVLKQAGKEKMAKLFTDLMHMHVNRLFNQHQRTNEMIMYYFLLKDMQRKKAIG